MERSLRLNMYAGFFGMLWMCAPLGAPLPLLMQSVEASSLQLGILSAVWQAAMLAQIPAAFLAEHLARRKPMWAAVTISQRVLWAAPALLPVLLPLHRHLWPKVLIVCLGVANLLGNLGNASWSSWTADLVPPEIAGRFWATRQRVLSFGLILGTALYGWLLDRPTWRDSLTGFQWVFALCAFFGVTDIVIHCFVREPERTGPRFHLRFFPALRATLRIPGYLPLTLLMAVWTGAQALVGFTLAMPGFFSMVHLRENFGATYSQASLIFIGAALGAALFTGRLGPWMDRAGAVAVLHRLLLLAPASMTAWWLAAPGSLLLGGREWPTAVLWLSLASLAQGAFFTGTLLCQFRLTQACTVPEGRTVAMGLHWSVSGVGGALGAFLAGWLKDALPPGFLPSWLGHGYFFDLLVLLHLVVTWGVVLPLCRRLASVMR